MTKKLYSIIALVALSVMAMLFAVSASATPGNPHKTTICHATHSATNPYVEITVDDASLVAHQNHQDREDIIPAPAEGCPGPVTTTTAPAVTTTLPPVATTLPGNINTTTTQPQVTTTVPLVTTIPPVVTTLPPVVTTLPPVVTTVPPVVTTLAPTVPDTQPPPPAPDTPTTVGTAQPPAPAPGFARPGTPTAPQPLALTGMNTADWTAAGLLMIVTGALCLRARRRAED